MYNDMRNLCGIIFETKTAEYKSDQ